ncbi:hypothetical protein [Aureimonas psammosilenae]|nr:hypothetical protein [Aureimonas psammosilenae]
MRTATATIKGLEAIRMIHRGHCILRPPGVAGEVRFIANLFDIMT